MDGTQSNHAHLASSSQSRIGQEHDSRLKVIREFWEYGIECSDREGVHCDDVGLSLSTYLQMVYTLNSEELHNYMRKRWVPDYKLRYGQQPLPINFIRAEIKSGRTIEAKAFYAYRLHEYASQTMVIIAVPNKANAWFWPLLDIPNPKEIWCPVWYPYFDKEYALMGQLFPSVERKKSTRHGGSGTAYFTLPLPPYMLSEFLQQQFESLVHA